MDNKIFQFFEKFQDVIIKQATTFLLAILFLLVGWWLINRFIKSMTKWMQKREIEVSLHPFLRSVAKITLRVLLIVSVAGMIGIQMTSFLAALGAAGLAIGMALQGSLSNFAGGIIILVLKPFKVGEFIESEGMSGTVREIQIFHTYLTTLNKQELIIPNGKLANSAVTNYSRHNIRGMSMSFKIDFNNDIEKVKTVLDDIIRQQNGWVETPAHIVRINELGDKYMELNFQAWFETDKYWGIHNTLREQVKNRFEKEGIEFQPEPSIGVKIASE